MEGDLGLGWLLRRFRGRVLVTWFLVLLENTLMALIPLFIGRAIDGLLAKTPGALWEVAVVFVVLVLLSVGRRAYDTRAYGDMRVSFGAELVGRLGERPVSQVSARLGMGREMVDFLEGYVPELMTALVQLVVSIVILWTFGPGLGTSATIAILVLCAIYALFHRRFYSLNRDLNTEAEEQVAVLEARSRERLVSHLERLRKFEIRLSDTDAVLYGAIYLGMFAFILTNLWLTSAIPGVTAGTIFAVLSYSWELVSSGTALPLTLQQLSRLSEIRERLNEGEPFAEPEAS